jgi:ankyrin repeat protein
LIAAGADLHICDGAALVIAAKNGHTDTVRALLRDGAGLRASRRDEARRLAAKNGHVETVRVLKEWTAREKRRSASGSETA